MRFALSLTAISYGIAAIVFQRGAAGLAIRASPSKLNTTEDHSLNLASSGPDAFKLEQNLPGVPFSVPQSYGGYLSVNKDDEDDLRKLYFFYTPTDNSKGQDDIIVWFNGGPGCSSMEGLFQETGPLLLAYHPPNETFQPALNAYSTHKVAHAIWIDSPGNTGFSQAGEHIQGLTAVAADVAGFFVNFFRAFPELKGKRLWLQGESYAGAMIPYMADHIYKHPELGLNLQGFHINDPSFANDDYMQQLPIFEYATLNKDTLNLTDDFLAEVKEKAEPYPGLTTYARDNLVYPPKGYLSLPPNWSADKFNIYGELLIGWNGAHCSSVYDISTQCPAPLDPLGYPQAATAPSADNFINNTPGFKQAIHANESIQWIGCSPNVFDNTGDAPAQESILAAVIDQSTRSIIGNGDRDVLLLGLGAQLAIQNTTWGGQLGFQQEPTQPLNTVEGGKRGIWHTERKLTWIQYFYAGHMVPQDDRPAGFKTSQYLVGQIDSLS